MWKLICIGALFTITNGHLMNTLLIKRLKKQVRELEDNEYDIYKKLSSLETNMVSKISQFQGTGETRSIDIGVNFEDRLRDMEGKIDVLKKYLMGEKRLDIVLRTQSKEVIKEMKGKVRETEIVIGDLKEEVKGLLNDFENKIFEVNKSANVKINANGAVLYGGIGSACTSNGGECLGEDSECRGGRCQCLPGLSYDVQAQYCVESCHTYGKTYQSVSRKIIRGFNEETFMNVSLADCKTKCNDDSTFHCRSFDYFPQWQTCYISTKVKTEVPDDVWEYNSEGYHFQRDCQ